MWGLLNAMGTFGSHKLNNVDSLFGESCHGSPNSVILVLTGNLRFSTVNFMHVMVAGSN